MASRRNCINSPDRFCYICGKFTFTDKKPITDFIKSAYLAYFGMHLGDQDKEWAPHSVCSECYSLLRSWTNKTNRHLKFGIPMVWREPSNHHDDCYFCMVKTRGFNTRNRRKITYPSIPSAILPVPHCELHPVPAFVSLPALQTQPTHTLQPIHSSQNLDNNGSDIPSDSESTATESDGVSTENEDISSIDQSLPQPLHQHELNDLVRDLDLSKDQSLVLASRLKEKKLLAPGTSVTFYKTRELSFRQFFDVKHPFVFCSKIESLLAELGVENYVPSEWRLFIDTSKRSLKGVLLHNGNFYGSIPLAHSVHSKESYDSVKTLLQAINYYDHEWVICVDLKMVNFLLGQQGGFTKYPCFLCLWDSRARNKHYKQKEWPVRESLVVGESNVINEALVKREKIIFPPLHIKLGLMKQFVKALDEEGYCFQYLRSSFPALSEEKVKAGIFDGPQIRRMINDSDFVLWMNEEEKEAWESFVDVVRNFLGSRKHDNYEEMVFRLIKSYKELGCNMSIKVHFLFSHLEQFPDNLGDYSDEQGERFHQDLKVMEERYKGNWDINMMADFCWSIKRDQPFKKHSRVSSKRRFVPLK